jgi:hypothetical protein
LAVLIFCYYWKLQVIFNSSALSFYTPDTFATPSDTYEKLGENISKDKTIIIATMVRDVEDRVPSIIAKAERLGSLFADYRVLIVENDSKDDTRKLLIEWSDKNPKVSVLGCLSSSTPKPPSACKIPSAPKTDGHSVDRPRIEKMVKLRNIYLDEIKRLWNAGIKPDYTAVWDMDSVSTVYLDGVMHTIGYMSTHPDVSSVCAYGIYRWGALTLFYDTYALLHLNEDFHISQKLQHDIKKGLLEARYKRGDEPYEVDSCFSGFALYRTDALVKASYHDPSPALECEHVTLNKDMPGKKLVNPSMVNLIFLND